MRIAKNLEKQLGILNSSNASFSAVNLMATTTNHSTYKTKSKVNNLMTDSQLTPIKRLPRQDHSTGAAKQVGSRLSQPAGTYKHG